ncbi:ulp1 protease family, C-terminal catalytic domain-containing protein [Tanacetum coccineum]|uniref:Ulp1 protease family, C-terminal catalytic domain-containing protein n=1 Tax=Tanacetum coccineum TaxID=301880 RepID=A0ABQ5ARN0_9ASTR
MSVIPRIFEKCEKLAVLSVVVDKSVKLSGLSKVVERAIERAVESVTVPDVKLAGVESDIVHAGTMYLSDADILMGNTVSVNENPAAGVKSSISYVRNLKGLRRPGDGKKNKLAVGKSSVDKEADVVQEDPTNMVIRNVLTQLDNAPDVENVKGNAPDVEKLVEKKSGKAAVAEKKSGKEAVAEKVSGKDSGKDKSMAVVDKDSGKKKSSVVEKDKSKDSGEVQENELKPKPKPEIKRKIKPKAKGSEVVNRKRKVSDLDSDSPSVDPDVVRMVISQLSKIKSEEFDDESVKKGKKKLISLEEAAHQQYLLDFPLIHSRTNPLSLFNTIQNADMSVFLDSIGFSSFINFSIEKLPMKLGMYVVSNFKDYKLSLSSGNEIEVTPFKIHEILDAGRGELCLDVVKRIQADTVISKIDWCGYVYHCLGDHKVPTGCNNYLGPLTFLILLYLDSTNFKRLPVIRTQPSLKNWTTYLMKQRQDKELEDDVLGKLDLLSELTEDEVKESEGFIDLKKEDFLQKAHQKLSLICAERLLFEDYMKKASVENSRDGMFSDLCEKYFSIFKDPISFEVDGDGNGNDDGDLNGDDDDDVNGDDGVDKKDPSENEKNPLGSNESFSFSKITLAILNDSYSSQTEPDSSQTEPVADGIPEDVNTAEEGVDCEDCDIMSSPEEYLQWLSKNVYEVGESCDAITDEYLYGDLFGDNVEAREAIAKLANTENVATPEILLTQKEVLTPSIVSPYMNRRKTNVLSKITKTEFVVANSLFAMEGDKIENAFEASFGEFTLYGCRLNLETLSPGLFLDSEVIDYWGAILNYEERFRVDDSKSRHFFPTGCITKTMLDGTLKSFDDKWARFSDQVDAQFKGNEGGKGLEGIDLVFFQICNSAHFYVVVFSLSKTTSMTILDNRPGKYDLKYKEVCDLLKKLFSRYLKMHEHARNSVVARVKQTIPSLKWKTMQNVRDCELFTMVHMEYFNGGSISEFDFGLAV